MSEARERLEKLYGAPASEEQVRLYFETFLHTYIQEAEKQPPAVREALPWYSRRPLRVYFYVTTTTVCFTVLCDADVEGVERVQEIDNIPTAVSNATTYLTGGTSLNGKKLYGVDSAIREAIRRLREDLRAIQMPAVRKGLASAGHELGKPEPDIEKLRREHAQLCEYLTPLAEAEPEDDGIGADQRLSPFGQTNYCPLLAGFQGDFETIKRDQAVLEERIKGVDAQASRTYKFAEEAIKSLQNDRSHKQSRKANSWVIVGVLVAIALGIAGILKDLGLWGQAQIPQPPASEQAAAERGGEQVP